MVKGLRASPLLQTHGLRPDKRAANGARGLVGLLMIALSSLALIIPGRLNRIVNAVVPASLVRGIMACRSSPARWLEFFVPKDSNGFR